MEEANYNPEHHSRRHKKLNVWMVATILFAAMLIFVLFTGVSVTGQITKNSAAKNFLNFANAAGVTATINNVNSLGNNLYAINASINGQEGILYSTKDGKYFIPSISPMAVSEPAVSKSQSPANTEVVKSDKPVVELFVMTYCPYGTQAEKGFIPAIQNLGSAVDAKIRFVHYFMHGDKEEQETYNQVCIREEQSAKYLDYLTCFLEDSNSTRCIKKVGVDQAKIDKCISSGKAKEYYAFDSQLSQGYGVEGSPTLVINGAQVSAGRDPASMLDAMCSAFNSAPGSCGASLSTTSPSPGFGTSAASSGSDAQCA